MTKSGSNTDGRERIVSQGLLSTKSRKILGNEINVHNRTIQNDTKRDPRIDSILKMTPITNPLFLSVGRIGNLLTNRIW